MAYENSKGSDKPAHPLRLTRTYAVCLRKRKADGKLQTMKQTCVLANGHAHRKIDSKVQRTLSRNAAQILLTHLCLHSLKRDTGKQFRPKSDAALSGV